MEIHNYVQETGEYIGTSMASPNPMEAGQFWIPANATAVKPLASKAGFAVVLTGASWEYAEDNRGIAYDTRTEVTVDYLGALRSGITKEAVLFTDAEIAAYDSQAYSRQRQAAYAQLNQFEMQFDDAANSTTTWIDSIQAIKAEYPKPWWKY